MDPLLRLPDVDALIQLINEGAFDNHLEDILAAAHGRKRERRGRRHPYGVTDTDRRNYRSNSGLPATFSEGDGVGAVEKGPVTPGISVGDDIEELAHWEPDIIEKPAPSRRPREHVIPGRACG